MVCTHLTRVGLSRLIRQHKMYCRWKSVPHTNLKRYSSTHWKRGFIQSGENKEARPILWATYTNTHCQNSDEHINKYVVDGKYTHTYIYICIYTYIHIYYTHVHIYTHIYECMYIYQLPKFKNGIMQSNHKIVLQYLLRKRWMRVVIKRWCRANEFQ